MADPERFKVKDTAHSSALDAYRRLCYGDRGWGHILWAEFLALCIGHLPGALGLALRRALYPGLFAACGPKVVFGRGLTLRHAHKIRIGAGTIIDDHAVLDAKGESNRGLFLGEGVYVGRNTILYCKNGDLTVGDRVNLSANCQVFSSNQLTIGADTVIGAFTYLLSGGEYDYRDPRPFSQQSGTNTRGPTVIGPNNWLGAHVVVTDGVKTGEHCVLAAGAVVIADIPAHTIAGGVPARPLKNITPGASA